MEEMETLRKLQRGEATEHLVYAELAKQAREKNTSVRKNTSVLERIAADEGGHYEILRKITGREEKPDMLFFWRYTMLAKVFGFTFGLKLMERAEQGAQQNYAPIAKTRQEMLKVLKDEERHEEMVLALLSDENLEYAGEVVKWCSGLRLNDAIVEFTGSIAGFTFALGDAKTIAITQLR